MLSVRRIRKQHRSGQIVFACDDVNYSSEKNFNSVVKIAAVGAQATNCLFVLSVDLLAMKISNFVYFAIDEELSVLKLEIIAEL